jgi:hypothetical protein
MRAGIGQETVKPFGGALADGEQAAFAAFSLADVEGAGGGIVVAMVELGHFGSPDTGGVEEFEDGAVAQAEGIGGVGAGEQAVDFFGAEGFGEVAGLFARQVEIGGGVGGDDAAAAEPGEQPADAAEAGELGIDDEGLPGPGRAVAVKVELIGFEGGAGESGRGDVALIVRLFEEPGEGPAVRIDGAMGVGSDGEGGEIRWVRRVRDFAADRGRNSAILPRFMHAKIHKS